MKYKNIPAATSAYSAIQRIDHDIAVLRSLGKRGERGHIEIRAIAGTGIAASMKIINIETHKDEFKRIVALLINDRSEQREAHIEKLRAMGIETS